MGKNEDTERKQQLKLFQDQSVELRHIQRRFQLQLKNSIHKMQASSEPAEEQHSQLQQHFHLPPENLLSTNLECKKKLHQIDESLKEKSKQQINSFEEQEEDNCQQECCLAQINASGEEQKEIKESEKKKMRSKNSHSNFHNLQKHLIAFLKKIQVRRVDLISKPFGLKAYKLWKIFQELKEYTKRSLYLLFGVQEGHNLQNLLKLSQSCPELKNILYKSTTEDIQQAQALIRATVSHQISLLSKNVIQMQCRMLNFEQFYSYLQAIMVELQEKGLSVRMSKNRKEKLIQKRQEFHIKSQNIPQ